MLNEITPRVLAELGPWMWMIAGFSLVGLEILVARGVALGFGLAAIATGTAAVLGASGVVPALALESQFGVWMLLSLALIGLLKSRATGV
ncbi:MAG: NfeD family protein [Notoacmeibacter sp.]